MKISTKRGEILKIKSLALILSALFILFYQYLKRSLSIIKTPLKKIINNLDKKIILGGLMLLFTLNFVFAIPNTITLQGRLTDDSGSALQGTYNMSFKIYDADTGGNILWQINDRNISTDANGVYDIIFKDVNLNFSDEYYLGITVDEDVESTPRVNLTSSPYAFRANVSEDLNPENEYKVSVLNATEKLIVNNTLYVNGSRVGIGTESPSEILEVVGNTEISGVLTIGNAIYGGNGVWSTSYGPRSDTSILFKNWNGDTLATIDNTGNVGIGTTSPATTLDVKGKVNVTGNFSVGETSNILFVDNTSQRVGIGTTSPTSLLHIDGGGGSTAGLNISNLGTATRGIDLSNSGLGDGDYFLYGSANVYWEADSSLRISRDTSGNWLNSIATNLYLGRDGSQTAIIGSDFVNVGGGDFYVKTDSGNVGIGTTSPDSNLEIEDTSQGASLKIDGQSEVNLSLERPGINVKSKLQFLNEGTYEWVIGTLGTNAVNSNDLAFSTDDTLANAKMFIDRTTGNVGIGTTSPSEKLVVIGNATIGGNLTINESTMKNCQGSNKVLTTDANGRVICVADQGGSGSVVNSTAWNRTGTNVLLSEQSDNVGIGTDTPDTALHIIGNVTINDSVSEGAIQIDSTNEVIRFSGENGSLYQPVYGTDDGLVLYLPFSMGGNTTGNTTSGKTYSNSNVSVYDRSPYGNDGQCYGTDGADGCNWTSGKYGNALRFDGSNDYVDVGNHESLRANTVTVEAWINPKETQGGDYGAIVSGISGNANQRFYYYSPSQTLRGWFPSGLYESDDTMAPNKWHHVAYVFDGTYQVYYINGKKQTPVVNTGFVTGSQNTQIGVLSSSAWEFNGSIDEVKIYSRALSAEEIRTHYLRGSGFGASGAITADKFRVVNTSGSRTLELNQTSFDVKGNGGDSALYVDKINSRVGIGTTSPSNELEVVGDIEVANIYENDGSTAWLSVSSCGQDTGVSSVSSDGTITCTADSAHTEDEVGALTNTYVCYTDGTDVLCNDAGIAYTTGTDLLALAGNLDIEGDIEMSDDDHIGIASNERIIFDTDGNDIEMMGADVGIGKSSPNYKLDVDGAINSSALNVTGNIRISELASCDSIDTDASGNFKCGTDAGGPTDIVNSTAWNRTGTNVVLAVLSDNVGIGKTNPASPLDVDGIINATGLTLPLDNDATTPTLAFGDGDTGFYESVDDTLRIARAGAAQFYIDSSGLSDSVNTLGPGLATEAGSATNPTLIPARSYLDTGIGSGADGQLSFIGNSIEMLRLDQNNLKSYFPTGNVGIGQTSPNVTLGVSGDANITGTLTVVEGANVTGGLGVSGLASCDSIDTDASGNFRCGTDAGGPTDIVNSTAWNRTGTNVVLAIQSDNVGIGNSIPNNTLDVSGDANITGYLEVGSGLNVSNGMNVLTGNVGIGTGSPGAKLEVVEQLEDNNPTLFVQHKSGLTNEGNYREGIVVGNGTGTGDKTLSLWTDSTNGVAKIQGASYAQAYDVDIALNPAGGNVGIGTTTPSSTLEVEGNMTVTDTNSTMGNFSVIQYNSTCSGFRFGATGGLILSCE